MKKFFSLKAVAILMVVLMLSLLPLQSFALSIGTPKTMRAFYSSEAGVVIIKGTYSGLIQPNRMYMINLVDAKGAMVSTKNPMGKDFDKGNGVFEYSFTLNSDSISKNTMPMNITLQCTTANVIEPISTNVGTLKLGDLSLDNRVDNLDATYALQYDAGIIELGAAECAGDVNKDGSVTNIDATYILKYDAGLIDSF